MYQSKWDCVKNGKWDTKHGSLNFIQIENFQLEEHSKTWKRKKTIK